METRKLELKNLCGYLSYELKFKDLSCNDNEDDIATLTQIDAKYNTVADGDGNFDILLKEIKPLLLPMFALTEPLPDGTIPIVELAKIYLPNFKWSFCEGVAKSTIDDEPFYFEYNTDGFRSITSDTRSHNVCNQLQLFEYLYSKHFDVHNLIEAGLAIDKRTIK